jgi:hypothetical protein
MVAIPVELNFLANKIGHCSLGKLHLQHYDFVSFIPSQFPNNNDIRHSASLGVIYDITNFALCGRYLEKRPT